MGSGTPPRKDTRGSKGNPLSAGERTGEFGGMTPNEPKAKPVEEVGSIITIAGKRMKVVHKSWAERKDKQGRDFSHWVIGVVDA